MGIDVWNLRFLAEARRQCGSFGEMLQIGRQELHIPEFAYGEADADLSGAGVTRTYRDIIGGDRWADQGLFPALGASHVSCLDASAYEGADFVQDLNDPIPQEWEGRFDTIFDGGSLEHIFNVPGVLANEMKLLKVGGRLLGAVPSNNWLGHGFYQFSPELPFRVFTSENGFRMVGAYLSEMTSDRSLYHVEDLARRAGGEIGNTNTNTTLYYIAVKTAEVDPFRRWPQQGDYSRAWDDHEVPDDSAVTSAEPADEPMGWRQRLFGSVRKRITA